MVFSNWPFVIDLRTGAFTGGSAEVGVMNAAAAQLSCVDYLGEELRFEMVYHLYSVAKNHRVRVKARLPGTNPQIDTLRQVWATADWLEREVFDMYGVHFRHHGDLRRLLLYEEFEGHPLRKDYPKEKRQPLIGPRN